MTISKPRVLYIPWDNPIHDEEAWKILNEKFELVYYNFATVEDYIEELKKPEHGKIGNIDAVCRSTWLKSAPYVHHYILRGDPVRQLPESVKLICQSGHGYDIVDVDYLTSKGILFCNSPNSCSRATADVGVYLIISSYRYLTFAEHCVRTGNYYDSQDIVNYAEDPNGTTLGIVGLGDIGVLVAKVCQAFGMKIIYHNRTPKPELEKELPGLTYYQEKAEFLGQSDCILVLCPHTKETEHFIDFDAFKMMKPKVRLVNIARGPIVEQAAVVDALERGQLVGAGFDVHEFEPKIDKRLLDNFRITLTPHSGAVSKNSFKNFEKRCVENLVQFFYKNEKPKTAVNGEVFKPAPS